jgi:starvation-inducible DNA-binding protein
MTLHATRNDIPAKTRRKVVDILNARLADAIDLSMQAKQAHWNVKGPHFIGLHELFDDVAEHAEDHVDKLAERITALGGTALGTVRAVAKTTSLKPYPENIFAGPDHVAALANALGAFAKLTRQAIEDTDDLDDEVTSDLFNEITGEADKDLWFVEAHLQAER